MKSLRPFILTFSAIALTLVPVSLRAVTDAEATAGRALVKRFADTVVSVEMVISVKVTMGDRAMPPQENKVEVNGTVLSPSGLTVTALSAIDPRSQLEAMRERSRQKMELGETEYKEVKLRLANGTEVPAVVVLKDADLDLAFIAPLVDAAVPATVFPFVKLEDAVSSELLGSFYSIARASKNLQRTPVVKLSTVAGIVEKPRRLYLLTDQAIGAPIFDAAGHVLGVTVQHLANGRPSGAVVLPAADIAEVAKQAAAIKPEQVVPPAPTEPAAPAAQAAEPAPKS
jgi:S1-C subfamily serine protease